MKIMTNKQFDNEMNKIRNEMEEREFRRDREMHLRRELDQLEKDVWEIKVKLGMEKPPVMLNCEQKNPALD